jgi:UDP-glucose 4-epimerase
MNDDRPTILITGAAGGLASILVDMLYDDYRLVGVDPRAMPRGRNFPGEFHQIDYTHRKMAEVFRKNKFETLLHLGRIQRTIGVKSGYRYKINVLGTRNLLELAKKHGLKNLIVFSSFHVYGADQVNPIHIKEEAPLRASQTFPELVDSIEMDHAAVTFLWRYQDVRTVVLRPVNVLGPRINNTVSQLLRSNFCPRLLGFDPLMQFIHERDIAKALRSCLKSDKAGVYNIAGEGSVPWSKAIELAGATAAPVPTFVIYPFLGSLSRLGISIPKYWVDYFRYPVVVSDARFRKDFGYEPDFTTVQALKSLRQQPLSF